MYFVKYHPLKEKLSERSLSDREALPYFVLFIGLTALAGSIPLFDEFNVFDGISSMLSVLTAIWGVFYAYKENGGSNGYDLIHKYVVLGWVVSVRFFIVFIPASIALYAFGEVLGIVTDETGWYDIFLYFVAEIILCQRIGRHIGDTKYNLKSEQNAPAVR